MITYFLLSFLLYILIFVFSLIPSGPSLPSWFSSSISWVSSLLSPIFLFVPYQNFNNVIDFFMIFIPAYYLFRLILFIISRGSSTEL